GEDDILERLRADRLGLEARKGFDTFHTGGEQADFVAGVVRAREVSATFSSAEPVLLPAQDERDGPADLGQRNEVERVHLDLFAGLRDGDALSLTRQFGRPCLDEALIDEVPDVDAVQGDDGSQYADPADERVD